MDLSNRSKKELIEDFKTLNEEFNALKKSYEQKVDEFLQSRTSLQIIEEQVRNSFEYAAIGLWFVQTNGRIIKVNKAVEEMLGYSNQELENKTFNYVTHPDDLTIGTSYLHRMVAGEIETASFEKRYVRKDGSIMYAITTVSLIKREGEEKYFFTQTNDISTRKQAEIELQRQNQELKIAIQKAEESEFKFKAAFYTSPDSVNINRLDGTYVDINEGFTRLTGFTREDVIGKLSSEVNIWERPEDRVTLIAGLQKYGIVENLESVFRKKDGSVNQALMSARIIRLNNEPHILSVTRDISERKKIEEELIKAKEKAEESDRLKTAFLQNMSHEIRTPMNAIMGFSELLVHCYDNKPKLEKYSKIVNQRCNDLLVLIDDILDIAKIESGQLKVNIEKCNINTLFTELKSFFTEQQVKLKKEHIDFNVKSIYEDSMMNIESDPIKIKQILINIIGNAFKFTEAGSITGGCTINQNDLIFYVSDTGIGISPELQQQIFERFFQINPIPTKLYGGTGLGLSIVKGLTELLGGKIWLESELGKGTTFYFSVPYQPV